MHKRPEGLGDSIANVTRITKLDKLVENLSKLAGKEDCGCKKRQDKLNKKFPYKR